MGGATIRLLVILGPTAVGKTDLALDLAPRLGGEIVSADSTQVYRGMDIGTDKPPPEARRRVPHHLVDLRDPDEGFDVATYQRLAGEAVANIAARGRLPMLVGGSGLYIRAVVEGYQFLPAGADPAVREELARRAAERGAEDLLSELVAVDPAAARAIGPGNTRRLIRALEVYRVTGRPISTAHRQPPPYHTLKLGLTRHREELYRRIEARVERELADGLVEEVAGLLRRYPPDLPAFQAVGYKEVIGYLQGRYDRTAMVALLKRNTRRLAKKQMTWFRRERDVIWLDAGAYDRRGLAAAAEAVVRRRWPDLPREGAFSEPL